MNSKPNAKIASLNTNIDLSLIYSTTPETEKFVIDENGGFMPFVKEFEHLGSHMDFLLDNAIEIRAIIKQVTKTVGALGFIWDSNAVAPEIKVNLHL